MEYTTEEKATIVVMRTNGSTFEEIQKVLKAKHNRDRSITAISQKYYKLVKSEKEPSKDGLWKDEPATTRQLRTLAYLTNPSGKNADRNKMVSSLKKQNLTKGQVSDQIKAANKIKSEVAPELLPQKEKKRHGENWSDKEIKALLEMVNEGISQREIATKLGRTYAATQKRLHSIRQNSKTQSKKEEEEDSLPEELVAEIIAEPVQEEFTWTHSQDMQILVDFYEMSIDEVRATFARPYWIVAQRLEMLFDSTEPEHISMLMEASEVVLKRKQRRVSKPSKPSRKERKEAKKASKRAAKVARLEAKMERKLNALRGVKDE